MAEVPSDNSDFPLTCDPSSLTSDVAASLSASQKSVTKREKKKKKQTELIVVRVRLVGEPKERTFEIKLDTQIRRADLVKKIEQKTKIPQEFQHIEMRGNMLPEVNHSLYDIKSGEELVVYHTDITCWKEYKDCVEEVLKQRPDKVELAKEAVRLHERLTKSKFFDAYTQFKIFRDRNHSKVAGPMRRGGKESSFICYFEERDVDLGGRPTNTIAFVQIHGENDVSKYNVKCHHFGPKGTSSGQVPDVSEFYCYKLLALIGVGPESHIIPPSMSTGTKTSTYIATKWDDKFEHLETLIEENRLCADVAVQLMMLRLLLSIADLHSQNCGKWKGTKNVAIVDFAPTIDITVHADIKKELTKKFPHHAWKKQYYAVKKHHDDISWLKKAKVYLDQWELSKNIELAREQFDPTKGILKRLEIGFKKRHDRVSPTDQLHVYIDILNKNVENLQNLLNSVVLN